MSGRGQPGVNRAGASSLANGLARLAQARVQTALLAAATAALALAWLNPAVPLPRRTLEAVVVLDITQSMNTVDAVGADGPVSRLAGARALLDGALRRLPCGSRIGLGVFTAYRSFVLMAPVEVCSAFQELRTSIADVDGRMAWAGGSEVAKGLYFGLKAAGELPGSPALVFITDGHEAPPINPRHRPPVGITPGEQQGLIVGVGGPVPQPIPKMDPDGKPRGYWRSEEVTHVDPYSQGRSGSVEGETLADSGEVTQPTDPALAPRGSEHLSSLREDYLRLLARESGLAYVHPTSDAALAKALLDDSLARTLTTPTPLQWPATALALACLALAWLGALQPVAPSSPAQLPRRRQALKPISRTSRT